MAGIIVEHIISPILVGGNLTVEKCLSIIGEEVVSVLTNLYSRAIDPSLPSVNLWF